MVMCKCSCSPRCHWVNLFLDVFDEYIETAAMSAVFIEETKVAAMPAVLSEETKVAAMSDLL